MKFNKESVLKISILPTQSTVNQETSEVMIKEF